MSFLVFLLLNLGLHQSAFSQGMEGNRPDLDLLTKSGKMLTIQVNPKNLQIQVAGKKAAQLDLKPLKLEATLIRPSGEESLNLNRDDNSFRPVQLPKFEKPAKLRVETRLKDKKETFEFELKQEPLP